jgi:hypothetical protein
MRFWKTTVQVSGSAPSSGARFSLMSGPAKSTSLPVPFGSATFSSRTPARWMSTASVACTFSSRSLG